MHVQARCVSVVLCVCVYVFVVCVCVCGCVSGCVLSIVFVCF